MNEQPMRSIAEIGQGFIAKKRHEAAYPMVSIDNGFIVLYDRTEDGTIHDRYDIAVSELGKGGKRAVFWIRQLAPKTWITKAHLERFADVIVRIFGME
jgi:hypothetical protein